MADIDVVKKGSNLWLWIILAIVIGLALWFMMAGSGDGAATGPRTGLHEGAAPVQIAALAPGDVNA